MKKWLGLMAAVLLLALTANVAMAAGSAVNDARSGVVYIAEYINIYDPKSEEPILDIGYRGSGFFVDPGKEVQYLVTCAHCVADYYNNGRGEIVEAWVSVDPQTDELIISPSPKSNDAVLLKVQVSLKVFLDDNTTVEAYCIDSNEALDVAVLRLQTPTDKRKGLKLQIPKDKQVGSSVYAIGFPSASNVYKDSVSRTAISDATVTSGVLSRLVENTKTGRRELQIDAVVSGGNSGGPVVSEKGYAIGVSSNVTSTQQARSYYAVNIVEVVEMLKRHNIPYVIGGDFPVALVIVMGAVILALVVLIVVILTKKGGRNGGGSSKVRSDRMLVCEAGALAGQSFPLKKGQKIVIGRNPDCQIRFPANTAGVSKVHCSVIYDGEKVLVRDENSSAGTYIDGNKLTPGMSVTLHRGHPLGLGSKAQILVLRTKQ